MDSSLVPTSTGEQVDMDVFEGPEKKLEVFFREGPSAAGFRQFQADVWSDLLTEAACTILHLKSNECFDAYLLSESSLFVFSHRVILKTCGTTTLLLVLPKLLELADKIGCAFDHLQYGHYRYKFPEQQLFPHRSFEQEAEYLALHFSGVRSRVLGPAGGRCWYVLGADGRSGGASTPPAVPAGAAAKRELREKPRSPSNVEDLPMPPSTPPDGEDIFEIAMEGLRADVCAHFHRSSHPPSVTGRALAARMTAASGLGALLPGVTIDDWAFEPCGYSMNGLRGGCYYTVHITPEAGFSYASFETNDPAYRTPAMAAAVLAVFAPAVATVTLTSRRIDGELAAFELGGYERQHLELLEVSRGVSVCAINLAAVDVADVLEEPATAKKRPLSGTQDEKNGEEMLVAAACGAAMLDKVNGVTANVLGATPLLVA